MTAAKDSSLHLSFASLLLLFLHPSLLLILSYPIHFVLHLYCYSTIKIVRASVHIAFFLQARVTVGVSIGGLYGCLLLDSRCAEQVSTVIRV